MEEQKKAKSINMNAADSTQQKKLTYDQLNDACIQLSQQNRQLIMRNRELENFAMNKRLDYLFKVLEYSNKFSSDFIVGCVSEIGQAMTIPQEPEEHKEEH